MNEFVFETRGAVVRAGGAVTLGPLSVGIREEETTALIGASGAGKSTLLRLFNGLVAPAEGEVLFRGQPLRGHDLPALRRKLGYVIQGGGLFPHLDAAANVTLVARCLRLPAARIEARVRELLRIARLPPEALARFPAQLSGGQAQRVSLMRALMLDPDVLLLDEPLGALDPVTRYDLQQDLRDVFERLRKTVVLVTHDLAEAAFFAGRVLLLRDGRVLQDGTVAELARAPADAYVTRFVQAQRRAP